MPVKITYFVHGTTYDNLNEISSGWSDVELSELGVQQSIDLKDKIKDKVFDVVFCSDLQRAVKSAELTFQNTVPIIQDKRLRECNYGKYNGQSSSIVEPMQEKNITERFPGGESYEDVKARIKDFLDFLKDNYDGKAVAIVAHKAPQLALDVLIGGKTWEEAFSQDWRKSKAWQPGWKYILGDECLESGGLSVIMKHRDVGSGSETGMPAKPPEKPFKCNSCGHELGYLASGS